MTSDQGQGRQTLAEWLVVLRCRAADAVARRSLAGDTDHISSLAVALDRLTALADRLRSDLARAQRTCSSYLDALHRRLSYHAEVGLRAGVERVFRPIQHRHTGE